MRCPNHLLRTAAGYCFVCGSFYCEDCLTRHEGNLYCPRHYKKITAETEAQRKHDEIRQRHGRQHLVLHFTNGKHAQGSSFDLNARGSHFHLECENDEGVATGETLSVRFADLKSICSVKSYTGKFDKRLSYQDYTPGGTAVVVQFRDGEVLEGITLHVYDPDVPRFYLIPKDTESNHINILVEAAALAGVYTPEEWQERSRRSAQIKVEKKKQEKAEEPKEVTQEESMGDFYFETHNYPGAVEQYGLAYEHQPTSRRVRKKLVVSIINNGIQFIKKRDYRNALDWMDRALEIEPDNPHAKKKATQLRKVVEKTERRMREYLEGRMPQK